MSTEIISSMVDDFNAEHCPECTLAVEQLPGQALYVMTLTAGQTGHIRRTAFSTLTGATDQEVARQASYCASKSGVPTA